MKLDPKKYGLSTRVVLIENEQKEIIISIDRKSRIIMKDGIKIVIRPARYSFKNKKQSASKQTRQYVVKQSNTFKKKE